MLAPFSTDTDLLRTAFSGFPCGVAALSAEVAGEPVVLIASSFTVGVSQEPPLVLFSVQRSSTTWPELAAAPAIGVSILGSRHENTCYQMASKDRTRRFAGVDVDVLESRAIVLDGAPIRMECQVEHTYPAGDHDIVVLRVVALSVDFDHAPLVWHRSGLRVLAS